MMLSEPPGKKPGPAALEMEQDEELDSLIREVAGEDLRKRSGGAGQGVSSSSLAEGLRTIIIRDESGAASNRVWKVLVFVLLGIVILFATDSIEIKSSNRKGDVTERIDRTDNPLLHYKPVVEEEGAIDIEAEAEGGSALDSMNTSLAEFVEENSGNEAAEEAPAEPEEQEPEYPPSPTRTYTTRGQPIDKVEKDRLTQKWGSWTLVDEKAHERPKHDFYAEYPNRDIPRDQFPKNAWQLDTEYVGKFLDEGIALVNRAQESILAEYGHGQDDEPGVNFGNRSLMFDLILYPNNMTDKSIFYKKSYSNLGWTSERSWENLKKRVLHSIMTQDTFIFAMAGHSAAAGHGNHFSQSYTLQVAWIMQPIFARLGVRHESRNFGNGGMGTAHNGVAAGSIFGPDVSLLMWDSGMTENGAPIHMLYRQAIMSGYKVPAIWHLGIYVAPALHDFGGADVGSFGTSWDGIPEAKSLQEIQNMKWAVRHLRCINEIHNEFCKNAMYRYNGTCWIHRDDFEPPTPQKEVPGGRAGWHPGNREHQLVGRQIAWLLLRALHEVLTEWKNAPDYVLPDEKWHVTEMYNYTRTKLAQWDPSESDCKTLVEQGYGYYCTVPFKGRTEFVPRGYAHLTNIRTIMPKEMLENIPPLNEPLYNPPDVFIPQIHPPPGEIDVLNIVENGVDFVPNFDPPYAEEYYQSSTSITGTYQKPGKGIYPHFYTGSDYCDGTLDSWCNKGKGNDCLLTGHNDGRTGFFFDGFSGWLIVNVPKVELGYIILKIETWHFNKENPLTEGWESIDNEAEAPKRRHARRRMPAMTNTTSSNGLYNYTGASVSREGRLLKPQPEPYCPEFRFEYAIDDGEVVSLNYDELLKIHFQMQRVVEVIPVLLPQEGKEWKTKDVQVAMRIIGCARAKVFSLTHVYWA